MTATPFFQVDAFTDTPFAGNPAAVCVLDGPAEEAWMQAVAMEMALSETAFCHPTEAGDGTWGLRWFTPTVEVALCGHATLATAHVLATEHGWSGPCRFHTLSGLLTADVSDDGTIVLDFPVDRTQPCEPPTSLVAAFDAEPVACGRGTNYMVVELVDAATVRSLTPDLTALAAVDARAVIVTAANDRPGFGCVSRMFGPRIGIPEDPVTGSAHTLLATWWAPRLGTVFRAEQASARGGVLDIELVGDRVRLAGRAVTVARGELLA